MASVLKRKRWSMQGIEGLKRAKATTDTLEAAPESLQSNAGWDAAFAPVKENNRLVMVNGSSTGKENLESSDAEDYEQFTKQEDSSDTPKKARKRSKSKASKGSKGPEWKVSTPVGGRMIDVDPVFTDDEK
jgi:NET1-associated nuclear protein 1 (U3 small nucleolar RNA-associated protein 17)